MMAGEVPTGVKVISVLYFIGAGFSLLFGLLFMVGAGFVAPLLSKIPLLGPIGSGFLTGFFILLGIIIIGLGVLEFLIGRGLWKGKNWARITATIIAGIGVLSGLYSIIKGNYSSSLGLAINLLVGYYLLFSNEVKSAFSSSA